jgi:hydroxyacylglutathione hydrolase
MYFQRVYDEDLAQASYLIGCQQTGDAIVVDGRRDTEVYRELADANGLRITTVTETHIHADYLSGTREIADTFGATAYVSAEGGTGWQYGFDATRIGDGDTITVGNVVLTALHTPGHTPEHLSFLITDGALTDKPGMLLSGDFVFVGDLGRPDLLDEAAGGIDTRYEGAKQMFASLRDKFLTLPDYLQVHPAHGAGSACGKALGAVPSSTVGYERLYSWWAPYLATGDEDGFIAELLEGQPDAPAYFGRMKRQNRSGPAILGSRPEPAQADNTDLAPRIEDDSVIFIDTRSANAVHTGTVTHALNVPDSGSIATYASWVIDPEQDDRPIVLLAGTGQDARRIWDHLIRVGIDHVTGFTPSIEGLPRSIPELVQVDELGEYDRAVTLDVRAKNENAAGAVPGSMQLHGGRVLWHLDELPTDGTVVTYCRSGMRSSVVASMLRAKGYPVTELDGSYLAWTAAHLPIESETARG